MPLRSHPRRRSVSRGDSRRRAARRALGALALAAVPGCAATDLAVNTARVAAEAGTVVTGTARGAAGGVARLGDLTPAGVRQAAADFLAEDGPLAADRRDYLIGDPHPEPTLTHATGLHEPAFDCPPNPAAISEGPVRVDGLAPVGGARGVWDLSLEEAIRVTLERTEVVREQNQFGASTNPLLSAPLAVVSVFDPAIQETGVGFNRGPEAALADFDAQFTSALTATRDETIQNNQFVLGQDAGETLIQDNLAFQNRLTKQFATGGSASFFHDVNRNSNNIPPIGQGGQNLFPSVYNTVLGVDFRQPILAGAGTRFNRIAGPNARNNRFLGNLDQGVLIARINTDQSIADFEREVRNLLRDVERAYYDLAAAYHVYDAEVSARGALLEIYRNVQVRAEEQISGGGAGDVALALDGYRDAQFRADTARANLLRQELGLRRLMNLPVNDGRIIRPADEPVLARFTPDWRASLAGALVNRVELRRQKWEVTRLALQLEAAKNAARPTLDLVSGYRVNGFGDQLLSRGVNDVAGSEFGLNSSYNKLADGNQTGYTLGFEFALPVGLRAAKVQVQNVELRLAKARSTLQAQEHEISHELAVAFQTVAEQYALATTALNRRQAAVDRVEAFEALQDTAAGDLDLLLRSEVSLAQAETQYWQSVYAYNQAIADVFYRQGTLLERDGVYLAEGDWSPGALKDAEREAWDRANALAAPRLNTDPPPFARPESPPVPLPDANAGSALPSSLTPGPGGAVPPPVPAPPAVDPPVTPAPAPAPLDGSTDAFPPPAPARPDGADGDDPFAPPFEPAPLPLPERSPGDRGAARLPNL